MCCGWASDIGSARTTSSRPIDSTVVPVSPVYTTGIHSIKFLISLLSLSSGTAVVNTTIGDAYKPDSYTFLIQSRKTSTCLANAPHRDPHALTYSHEALYTVVMVVCNTSSPSQRWQWREDGSLLHTATLLCLTMFLQDGEHRLVLGTCKDGYPTQEWSCRSDLIEQPDTEMCVTASSFARSLRRSKAAEARRVERSLYQGSLTDPSNRGGRGHSIEGLTEELEKILNELGKIKILEHQHPTVTNTSNEIREEVDLGGGPAVSKMETVVDFDHFLTFEPCNRAGANNYQKWSVLSYQSVGENIPDGGSLCSAKETEIHNLRRCYVEDMERLSLVTMWMNGWATCTRPGYYINGFGHTFNIKNNNLPDAGLISGLLCCAGDRRISQEPETPPEKCSESEWWTPPPPTREVKAILAGGWFTCPQGFFLKGLHLTARAFFPDENLVTKARCCKQASAPDRYMYCYKTNMTRVTDTGMHSCHSEEFLVTEMHRHSCNSDARMCDEEITCCMQV